jgi:hypothetical protein
MAGVIDGLVGLVFAFIILYVGWTIIYALNPILAVLFIILGVYVVFRVLAEGGGFR